MKNRLLYVVPAIVLITFMVIGTIGTPSTQAQDGGELMAWSAECGYGGNIQAIEAVDELTVKFTLCNPDPAFPSKAAFSAFAIHPSEHLEATGGGGDELVGNPIGTGPYQLENWERGESISLSRFDDYWGDAPAFANVSFRWNSEGAARYNESSRHCPWYRQSFTGRLPKHS
jgi:ABC-type transport system substrate-binding protein